MKGNKNELDDVAIITADEIKLILDRYRIGKKPLAKLLGWGETTIIRYMEGDIPTNEYSNKLKNILEDPEFYYDLLCKRKEALTGVAYRKSKKAVMSKILATKIYAVAYYIVNKTNAEVSAAYIQYLLYYAQAFSLALYDKELFQEEYFVNKEHIPYLKLYEGMKRSGIHILEDGDEYLEPEERVLIDSVIDSFSWYGLKALQYIVNQERTSLKISRDKYNNKVITRDVIKTYFKEVLEQYQISNSSEIGKYPDMKLAYRKEQCT